MEKSIKKYSKSKKSKSKKSKFKISVFEYNIWQILQYFIIYSFVGFIIETIYGLLTEGVIESRQSMLYGPFCCVYGLGAICLICMPKQAKKNNWTLFGAGFIIGSIVEYLISWIGDCIFHVKWWDYTDLAFNINGRVCLIFSIFWGILTVLLNKSINPKVDEMIDKIPVKKINTITMVLIIFMFIDFLISSFALKMFYTRLVYNYDLEVQGIEEYYEEYLSMYKENQELRDLVDTLFSDKKMLKTFPNLKLTLKDGNILLVSDVLVDIKPYYIKVF